MASRPLGAGEPRDGEQKQGHLSGTSPENGRLSGLPAFLSPLIFILPGVGRVGKAGDSSTGSLGSNKKRAFRVSGRLGTRLGLRQQTLRLNPTSRRRVFRLSLALGFWARSRYDTATTGCRSPRGSISPAPSAVAGMRISRASW